MTTELKTYKVRDLVAGFVYNEAEGKGLYGLNGSYSGPFVTEIWKLGEMDADHVAAWSHGGATSITNCQILCKTHNRAKGNR